jgi:hypothetical protein
LIGSTQRRCSHPQNAGAMPLNLRNEEAAMQYPGRKILRTTELLLTLRIANIAIMTNSASRGKRISEIALRGDTETTLRSSVVPRPGATVQKSPVIFQRNDADWPRNARWPDVVS